MANQYTKLTAENIRTKMNRQRNPVTSVAELAREFGYNTSYWWTFSTAAPPNFRNKVKALVGEDTYNQLRQSKFINKRYR